jgi:hypothetical protein
MLLGAALACLPAAAATAQEVPEQSVGDKETARQLMDLGDSKYDSGDYAGALEAYQGADRIMGVTSTGLAMGKALVKLGRLLEARDKLLAVSRIAASPDESPVLTQAREEARQLQDSIADKIPQLTVRIIGVAAGVECSVRVDGHPVPPATISLPRAVDPGKHTVSASAPGYHAVSETVTLEEGAKQTITLALRSTHKPPVEERKPEPGITVSPLVWAGIAVAGAGVVVGAITGGLSLSAASDVKDECTDNVCPRRLEEDGDRSLTLAHVSTASFIVAGVGAALAGVGLVLTFTADDERASITLGPGSVRGAF